MKRVLFLTVIVFFLAACGGETAVSTEATAVPAADVVEEPAGDEASSSGEAVTYAIGAEANEPRTYSIVADESTASYLVDEEFFADALTKFNIQPGDADVIGSTNDISGELQLNFGNADLLESGSFVVNLVSLTTDQNRRDSFIRDNHLESNLFPDAIFEAKSVSSMPDAYTEGEEISFDLLGDITIREISQEVTFEVTAVLQDGRLTGVARLPIAMSTFGIEPPNFANTLTVADDFVIQVEFTAVES
ncbi:MAG: YceI family protein [Chloroflexota bacterium]